MSFSKDQGIGKIYSAIIFALVISSVLVFEKISGVQLSYYGIIPREVSGMFGILLAPMLHSGWEHLIGNMFSFTLLIIILFFTYERSAVAIISIIWVVTGGMVWLIGKENTYHIGASGVIYGLVAFLFFGGIFKGERKSIMISLLVLLVNGGIFNGFLPIEGISWESHLYGALTGMVVAFVFKNVRQGNEEEVLEETQVKKTKYFIPDVFQYTKAQRYQMYLDSLEQHKEEEEHS
jgi:membrane associated rhomboid family serine protease